MHHTLPRHTHTHTHAGGGGGGGGSPPHDTRPPPRRHRPTTHLHVHHMPPDSRSDTLGLGLADMSRPMPMPMAAGPGLSPPSDADVFDSDSSWDRPCAAPCRARRDVQRVSVRMPARTAERLGPNDVLVLPRDMVRLRIQVRQRGGGEVLRALVPGGMRVGDAVRQAVGGEERALVRWRGRWADVGVGMRVDEVVARLRGEGEERVVDVLVDGLGWGLEREGEGAREGPARWERSRDVERMRVF
jgi:hypothetical protein